MKRSFARFRHALVLAVALGIAVAGTAASANTRPAKKAQFHGAIALDRDLGRSGFAVDRPTARAAAVEALNQCGGGRCEVVLAFKSSCGALANNQKAKQWATSTGATRQEAETKALRRCTSASCEIAVWACTR